MITTSERSGNAVKCKAIEAARGTILENLPDGYEESMQFGMIGYCVVLLRYPKTYNARRSIMCRWSPRRTI